MKSPSRSRSYGPRSSLTRSAGTLDAGPCIMLTVIGRGNSANVQKVLWYLSEMGIIFTREDFAGHPDGRRAAALLRLNPNGLVPILIDGEFAGWESNTILRYIANKFGPSAWYSPDAR